MEFELSADAVGSSGFPVRPLSRRGEDLHGADQARGAQGRIRSVSWNCGVGNFVGPWLGVADQAIDPEVGPLYLERVAAAPHALTDVDPVRRLPGVADGMAVY